jgi:hypothetical protein
MSDKFIAPIVGATVSPNMDFRERVFWYEQWIKLNPYSHIHFQLEGECRGFVSERHVNL